MNIVIHRCQSGCVLIPEIVQPNLWHFAETGPSLDSRTVACVALEKAGLSTLVEVAIENTYLVLRTDECVALEAELATLGS